MPTYDYKCTECGHQFEHVQKMTARPLRRCPECQGQLKRLIGSGAGIIFKGSGFYATDYRSDDYKKAADKDKKASSNAGDKKSGDQKDSTEGSSKTGAAAAKKSQAPTD